MQVTPTIRSRKGCITCKQRRKKCDERLPFCERCVKGGYKCGGYQHMRTSSRDHQVSTPSLGSSESGIHPPADTLATTLEPWTDVIEQARSKGITLHIPSLEIASRTPESGRQALHKLLPVHRIFSSDLRNNLLELYASFYMKLPWNWQGPIVDMRALVIEKAKASAVLRNAMLSLAALSQSAGPLSSTAISWRKQAGMYHQSALALLSEEVRRPDIPAYLKLSSIVEIILFEMKTNPNRCQSCRILMEQVLLPVVQALGTNVVNLADFKGVESLELGGFAWTDIYTSLILGKPTLLSYEYQFPQLSDDNPDIIRVQLEWMVCCPNPIIYALACITDLRSRSSQLSTSEVGEEARRIEEVIAAWRPPVKPIRAEQLMACAQECWRFTALIFLYRSIHHVGALHPVIQDSSRQMIALGRLIPAGDRAEMYLFTPFFMAGTAAISTKDRVFIRERLRGFAMDPVSENMHTLEEMWDTMDTTGCPVSWEIIVAKWQR